MSDLRWCETCRTTHRAGERCPQARRGLGVTPAAEAEVRGRGRCATPGCQHRGTRVDHVVPRSEGGSDGVANLQLLCDACHLEKTQEDRLRATPRRIRR